MSYSSNKQTIINKLAGSKFFAVFDENASPHTVTVNGQTQELGGFTLIPTTDLVGQVADLLSL